MSSDCRICSGHFSCALTVVCLSTSLCSSHLTDSFACSDPAKPWRPCGRASASAIARTPGFGCEAISPELHEASDSKASDSKASDSRASDSKAAETKAAETKPPVWMAGGKLKAQSCLDLAAPRDGSRAAAQKGWSARDLDGAHRLGVDIQSHLQLGGQVVDQPVQISGTEFEVRFFRRWVRVWSRCAHKVIKYHDQA